MFASLNQHQILDFYAHYDLFQEKNSPLSRDIFPILKHKNKFAKKNGSYYIEKFLLKMFSFQNCLKLCYLNLLEPIADVTYCT